MADHLVVLVGQRRYGNSEAPMATVDLHAFITAMEDFATEHLGIPPPTVKPSDNGAWIRFEFTVGDD